MIFFDTTRTGPRAPRSGLTRVSTRLREELGGAAKPIAWSARTGRLENGPAPGPDDWFFTTELFSPAERPGFAEFIAARPCRFAAVFHDAIPLQFPHTTWPQSVARHPGYLKQLAAFDRIWAVSETSRADLLGYWRWLGLASTPAVEVLPLGADFDGRPRPAVSDDRGGRPHVLCVGIIEPRKNQGFLLEVCDALWSEGLDFELDLVGRVNPHFGPPILRQLKALQRRHPRRIRHHDSAGDETLARLHRRARVAAFPTRAEGCGLPLLEALWMNVPVLCSDLPVLAENHRGGGCVAAALNDLDAWRSALRWILTDDARYRVLASEAAARPLTRWAESAAIIRATLERPR